ncbi:phage tail tube protein [uncultured Parolsenella sp.]|uniref:phage tail tube protein n=1 Tax=uncultured Parolsenella sp. TaxID=2083008 RepID=UPI0027D94A27|nr:phage tail tube protein [uncultured Parolsenella sp.]
MAINPSIGLVGLALQSARDEAAKQPTYVHGLTGGSPFSASRSIENTPVACGTRAPSDARVDTIEVGANVESLCYPDALGLYLYAALGSVTTTAVVDKSGYFQHVFRMGDKLPYLTFWSQVGVDNFTRTDGCKCSKLTFNATGNKHLAMTGTFVGIDAQVGIDGIPGHVAASCYGGKYTTTDCEFRLDAASETPTDALVSEASFTIANGTSALTSLGRVTPRDIADGNLSFGCSVTTIPDDITQYKKMVTGSKTSNAITGKVVMGSVYAKFLHTDDPNMTLEFSVGHVPFTADYPSVDPEGDEGTIQFTADAAIITAAGESPATITLVNKVASYVGSAVSDGHSSAGMAVKAVK